MRVCASFCPISYHKSIGGRSSSATSSRRTSTGRSRRVAAASRRSGRSARRAGPREARFVHVVDLARQSRAMVFAWWNSCIIRPYCAADGGAGGGAQEEQGSERLALQPRKTVTLILFYLFFYSFVNTQSLRQPVDGCEGAGESNAAGGMLFNFMSCPPRLSQGLFFSMHVNRLFFLTLGLHTVYCYPRHAMACSFQDFITTCSARGLVAVFTGQVCVVHLIVTVTGAHWTRDLRRARTGDSTGGRANIAHLARQSLFSTLFNRL